MANFAPGGVIKHGAFCGCGHKIIQHNTHGCPYRDCGCRNVVSLERYRTQRRGRK